MPNEKRSKSSQMKKKKTKRAVSTGSASSSSLMGQLGKLATRAVKSTAKGLFAGLAGSGDYTVSHNTVLTNQAPLFMNKDNGFRLSHREFVSDVNASTTFAITDYLINPGNYALFRWLSGVAKNFESFRFHGLVFYYKSTSGTAISSANPAQGTVTFATQYDVFDPLFTTKQEALAYEFSTDTVPYEHMLHPVECKPSRVAVSDHLYVTNALLISELPSGADARLYFPGRFSAMRYGQQSTGPAVGELWVSYDIEFFTPKANESLSSQKLTTALSVTAPSVVVDSKYLMDVENLTFLPQSSTSMFVISKETHSGVTDWPFVLFQQAGVYQYTYEIMWPDSAVGTFSQVWSSDASIEILDQTRFCTGINDLSSAAWSSYYAHAPFPGGGGVPALNAYNQVVNLLLNVKVPSTKLYLPVPVIGGGSAPAVNTVGHSLRMSRMGDPIVPAAATLEQRLKRLESLASSSTSSQAAANSQQPPTQPNARVDTPRPVVPPPPALVRQTAYVGPSFDVPGAARP